MSDTASTFDPNNISIVDDFEDGLFQSSRTDASTFDSAVPRESVGMAGDAIRGQYRPHWSIDAGDFSVGSRTDSSGASGSVLIPGTTDQTHIASTYAPVTAGLWAWSATFGDIDDSGEALIVDIMWDPAADAGWRVVWADDLNFYLEKHHHEDGVSTEAVWEWKQSWNPTNEFERCRVRRFADGRWYISIDGQGRLDADSTDPSDGFADGYLPPNPCQIRYGTIPVDGGSIRNEKWLDYIGHDASETIQTGETYPWRDES
jgi:hypothetical protein